MPVAFPVQSIIKGSNGKLYWVDLAAPGDQTSDVPQALPDAAGYKFMYEVGTFAIDLHTQETDYPAPGEEYMYSIPQHHWVTISLTQTVLRTGKESIDLLSKVLNWVGTRGDRVNFAFIGTIEWAQYNAAFQVDSTVYGKKCVVQNCIPTGTFNILGLQPGQVLNRPLTFRANSPLRIFEPGQSS